MPKVIRNNLYPILLGAICLIIILLNHVPGTYLSGWDTLHPEFNFPLSLQRIIFGVFRSEQGVGAVAAHSHMSDLPRVLMLWFGSIFLPNSWLRFIYVAACLPIGVLGVYFFAKKIVLGHLNSAAASSYAFMSAVFYLFNLGTLQHFYLPFEMFQTQYAFLPWLFLGAANFLKTPTRKNIVIFSVVSLLSTPMAFASTLWLAYFLALCLYLLFFLSKNFKQVMILVLVSLAINSFWLLPNLYFLLSGHAAIVPDAKINKIFSEEAYINNVNFGDFKNALVFKNFLFNWPVYLGGNQFDYVLGMWRTYLGNFWISFIGYLFSGFVLIGVVKSLFEKDKYTKLLLLPGLLAFLFLIGNNPVVGVFFGYFRDHSDIFKEALRFPFTKFSIILMFVASCFFGLGQTAIMELLAKTRLTRLHLVQALVVLILGIMYMFPVFQGQLISKYVQVKIPDSYFEMFSWFNTQTDGRIANLPVHSFWGWVYYDWGFQGAQFTSFGIKQPILDRDYDRWNPDNENYYRQITSAVYSQNLILLEQVLTKYNIKYLLLDTSVLNPSVVQNDEVLYYDQIKKLVASSENLKLVKTFGKVLVYEYSNNQDNAFIRPINNFTKVAGPTGPYEIDFAYLDHGDYIKSSTPDSIYPFKTLSNNQNYLNSDLITQDGDNLSLQFKALTGNANLSLINYLNAETQIPAAVFLNNNGVNPALKIVYRLPIIKGSENRVDSYSATVDIPKDMGSEYFVNFNNQQTLHVDNLLTKFKSPDNFGYFLGNVFISTQQADTINFYKPATTNNPVTQKNYGLTADTYQSIVQLCGDSKVDQVFYSTLERDAGGFKMRAKNSKVCVRLLLNKIIPASDIATNSLLQIHFRVSSQNTSVGQYCIFDKADGRCIKDRRFIENGFNVVDYLSLNPSEADRYELVFYLNAEDSSDLTEIGYQDLGLQLFYPVSRELIDLTQLRNSLSTQNLVINQQSKLEINFPAYLSVDQPELLKTNYKSSFCSSFIPSKFDRVVNLDKEYVEYSSTGGSSCDFFEFPELSHQSGYILTMDSQTLSGLPLRMCVANTVTKRCDLFTSLPKNQEFGKVSILIPPSNDGGFGYNIHFDNYSIGGVETINRVKRLQIRPFPYTWVNQLEFSNPNQVDNGSKLTLSATSQIFPGLIRVNYANNSPNEGVVELDKSFENDWWGIGRVHVEVNDWANGWLIPGYAVGSLWIFYWPQLLEFLGFGLAVGGVWILVKKLK